MLAFTTAGKGYAGTRFVGAAAHDAMRQHSGNVKEGSRELNEEEGVEDSAGNKDNVGHADAEKDQPLQEQQNGPPTIGSGAAAAGQQQEDRDQAASEDGSKED
eukprot:scaffold205968_cov13-Tisochrysis_lutea.AAC.1